MIGVDGLSVVAASHRGLVRPGNEDCVGAFGWVAPEQTDPIMLVSRSATPAVVAVADGLGGHAMGERASRLAVHWLMAAAPRLTDAAAVSAACLDIHRRLIEDAARDAARTGMGTTLTAVVVLDREFLVVNVGDSRTYHVEPGLVDQLTDDDAAGDGALTQCLGGQPGTTVRPAVASHAVQPSARLLLCSDGLHGIVPRPRFRGLLDEPDPFDCVTGLLDAALHTGAPDNVSICLLTFPPRTEDCDD